MAGGEEINTPHTAEKEGEYQQTRGGAGHWDDARAACWSLSAEGGAFVGRELRSVLQPFRFIHVSPHRDPVGLILAATCPK